MKSLNTSGIYQIQNINNGHCYIGSAINIRERWNRHVSLLRCGKHHSSHLQSAWNTYGEDCFTFSVLELCDKDNLITREQAYIDERQPKYNMCLVAGNVLGIKRGNETRNKLSNALKGIIRSVETRKRISESKKGKPSPNKGKVFSDEYRKKLSDAHKGVPLSESHRASLSSARKGKPSHWKGKTRSIETKKKLSETMKAVRQAKKIWIVGDR